MKKILCFGDSNTYGFIPVSNNRYSKNQRWSGILSEILGKDYRVIEEGMNNRTGFMKNPESIKLCAKDYLPIYLQNHRDIDICILSVGTNDAQFFYNLSEGDVEKGLKSIIKSIKEVNENTKIIIVPPVKITENILNGNFSMLFDKTSIEKIEKTFYEYKWAAYEHDCSYLDFNKFATPSKEDGLHYSTKTHEIIAQKVAEMIHIIS